MMKEIAKDNSQKVNILPPVNKENMEYNLILYLKICKNTNITNKEKKELLVKLIHSINKQNTKELNKLPFYKLCKFAKDLILTDEVVEEIDKVLDNPMLEQIAES